MMFDTLMSGRYDWILFPLGLAVIALFVTAGLWAAQSRHPIPNRLRDCRNGEIGECKGADGGLSD